MRLNGLRSDRNGALSGTAARSGGQAVKAGGCSLTRHFMIKRQHLAHRARL